MTPSPALPGEASARIRKKLLPLLLATGCLLVVLFFPIATGGSRLTEQFHDYAHLPIFALLTLAMAAFSRPQPEVTLLHHLRWGLRLFTLALLLGSLVELVQSRMGRTAELSDVIRDAGGSAAVLFFLLSRHEKLNVHLRRGIRLLALLIPLVFLVPLSVDLVDELQARWQFPSLADFESATQLLRFKPKDCRLRRVRDPAHPAGHQMEATFQAGLYPRVELRYFPGDWRGYGSFAVTCVNPGTDTVKLFLRINDRQHDRTYRDRYNVTLSIPPGRQEIVIPLDAVKEAPLTREMNMDSIVSANFYVFRLREARTLLFDNFRLLPEEAPLPNLEPGKLSVQAGH